MVTKCVAIKVWVCKQIKPTYSLQESSSKKTLARFMLDRRRHTMLDLLGSGESSSHDQGAEQLTVEGLWTSRKTSSFITDGPVVLDVGGERFTTSRKVLAQYPNTR